jgi:hypothetical protein
MQVQPRNRVSGHSRFLHIKNRTAKISLLLSGVWYYTQGSIERFDELLIPYERSASNV